MIRSADLRAVAQENRRWDRKVRWARFWTRLRVKIGRC